MNEGDLPKDWPLDLGGGYKGEWANGAIWIHCPKLAAAHPDQVSPGDVRIPFEGPGAWQLVQRDPVTLHPSISVKGRDGAEVEHFYVRDGKVVQA